MGVLQQKRAFATYLLIILNLLIFALEERAGGSQNLEVLYQFGGLVPQEVFAGQWWRLLSANFLHFGWIHLISNMLGLLVIGRLVEKILGTIRYLILYLGSGIGAMFLYALIALKTEEQAQILVGASAAIMGLVGALLAILIRLWQRDKSKFSARNLRNVLLIIGLQFFFDINHPEISFLSHLLGLLIGLFVGIIMIFI